MSYKDSYLKWNGEESNHNVSQRQVGNKTVGDILHAAGGGHYPHDQGIPNHGHHGDSSIEDGQQDHEEEGNIIQGF